MDATQPFDAELKLHRRTGTQVAAHGMKPRFPMALRYRDGGRG